MGIFALVLVALLLALGYIGYDATNPPEPEYRWDIHEVNVEVTRLVPVARDVEKPVYVDREVTVVVEKPVYIKREIPVRQEVEVPVFTRVLPTWTPFNGFKKFKTCGQVSANENVPCENLYIEAGKYKVTPNCTEPRGTVWWLRFRDHYGYTHEIKGLLGDPTPHIYHVVDMPALRLYDRLGKHVNIGGEIPSGAKRMSGHKYCVFKIVRVGD